MANVLTVLKLVPDGSDFEQDKFISDVLNPLLKKYNIEYIKKESEPIAFGLEALIIYVKNEDSEEGADNLNNFQEELENLENIQAVELQHQTLIDY